MSKREPLLINLLEALVNERIQANKFMIQSSYGVHVHAKGW